ncbi:hypothetical protein WMY93_026360 [Mugilogobius chulae]|uniref:B box-type domain-containing protein n=1 Tax=Mugilogobius chulae TaxID=88201 RepID=A0AAW0MY90_9GOBI
MSARGVGKLCFLKKTVNAAIYQDVLETFLIPTVEEQFGEEDFIFQQDLALAHAAKSTKDWFTRKQLEVLAWPANSPDLYVIENLWAIIKRKIRDRKPTKLDQLKQNIATAWEAVTVAYLSPLVLRKELESLLENEGESVLSRPSLLEHHSILFWNLLWVFSRLQLPSHLLQLVRSSSLTGHCSQVENPCVRVRLLWDTLAPDTDQWPPLYVACRCVSSLGAVTITRQPELLEEVLRYVGMNEVHKAVTLFLEAVGKRQSPARVQRSELCPEAAEPVLLTEAASSSRERERVCSSHPEQRPLFCLDECRPLCPTCEFSLHYGHKVVSVDSAVSELKEQLRSQLQPLTQRKEQASVYSDTGGGVCVRALREEQSRQAHTIEPQLQKIREEVSTLEQSILTVRSSWRQSMDFYQRVQTHSSPTARPKPGPGLL